MVTTTPPRLVHANGIDLACQSFGDGDLLILLHGGFGSVEMFGPVAGFLDEARS
jgi:pimeloyl-ACP methyl ester carboxylesterase